MQSSRRLSGWTVFSGTTYFRQLDAGDIVKVEDEGIDLAQSFLPLSAGEYFYDRVQKFIYVNLGPTDPNFSFVTVTEWNLFSMSGRSYPLHVTSGEERIFMPLVSSIEGFDKRIDSKNQIGFAIEGSGSVNFVNDLSYWKSVFDKRVWDGKFIDVWTSVDGDTPVKRFQGEIKGKKWSIESVTFDAADELILLRADVDLPLISELGTVRAPNSVRNYRQRRVYGVVKGHVPTNVDQARDLDLDGYPTGLTGLITTSTDSVVLTVGDAYLTLNEGDSIRFADDTTNRFYRIKEVQSSTLFILAETYTGTTTASEIFIKPSVAKSYINRRHCISHHALRDASSDITQILSPRVLRVSDASDFEVGDFVILNGEENQIVDKLFGERLKFIQGFSVPYSIGDFIEKPAVSQAFLGSERLVAVRDYTVTSDGDAEIIVLDELCEREVAESQAFVGSTVTITSGSRTVTVTAIDAKNDLQLNDWIRGVGESDWFQIFKIVDETTLVVRQLPTSSYTGLYQFKRPEIFKEGESVLSLNITGKTDTGTPSGNLLKYCGSIVEDILIDAGITAIDSASFAEADDLAVHRLGFVIPESFKDTKVPTVRDVINKVNTSVFGSLIQDENFELSYRVLSPERIDPIATFDDKRVLSFEVNSESDQIVSFTELRYSYREAEVGTGNEAFSVETFQSDFAQYLVESAQSQTIETILVDQTSAQVFASRWGYLNEYTKSAITVTADASEYDLNVTDQVLIDHSYMYERIGSTVGQKIGHVQSFQTDGQTVRVTIDDLGNTFSRSSVITENEAFDYAGESIRLRSLRGYITANNGVVDNDPDTVGTNLIF